MNKLDVYCDILDRENEEENTFLKGLLFLDEFSFFYDIIKVFINDIEVLPSFRYDGSMRNFSIKVINDKLDIRNITNKLQEYIKDGRFEYSCSFKDNIINIVLK